jgi:hypothetical protein
MPGAMLCRTYRDKIADHVIGGIVVLMRDVVAIRNRTHAFLVDLAMEEQAAAKARRSSAEVPTALVEAGAVELLAGWRDDDWIHGANT